MQAALRRTSDCLFSMRSYRVSCTRTSRSRTLFPVPLPPWLLLPFCSPLRPCQTAAVAPSHQLTLPFLCTGAQRRASPHRCSHRSSTFLALSIRSLFTGSTLSLLSHALCAPPLSLSLSSSLRYRSSQLRSFSFSRATTSARESPRVHLFYLTVAWLFAHPWNEESVRAHRLGTWISQG